MSVMLEVSELASESSGSADAAAAGDGWFIHATRGASRSAEAGRGATFSVLADAPRAGREEEKAGELERTVRCWWLKARLWEIGAWWEVFGASMDSGGGASM